MSRREKLPFPVIKIPRLAGLGKIEGEHTEYKVSVGTWKALFGLRKNVPHGICFSDAEQIRRYMSIGRNLNGRHVRNRKALTEMSGLADLLLREVRTLRKKGVKGAVPMCLQPVKSPHPDPRVIFIPESTELHERFHAQNSRRRVRLNTGEGDRQVNCEGDNALKSAAKLVRTSEKVIRGSMPDYWVPFVGAGWKPEELFARAEPLRTICHVKKDKKTCKLLTERFKLELKNVGSRKPNLIRDLADAMQRRRVTGEKLFDGFAKSCKIPARRAHSAARRKRSR
jgi:hypothetical protein